MLLTRVLYRKHSGGRDFLITDAGMTELIRPALYDAWHEIDALTSLGRPVELGDASPRPAASLEPARVEGPICESTDHLGEHRLPALRRGDLVVIRDAGAYGASLGSTYNGRPRPPQLLLDPDGSIHVGRRRGSVASLG
jgi:diaminopimelate decarboxylase